MAQGRIQRMIDQRSKLQISRFTLLSGITGRVNIDENGDRTADFSLLDMNEETGEFQVISPFNFCVQY